jgi:hypothetical protein
MTRIPIRAICVMLNCLLLAACATPIKPSELRKPNPVSCIHIPTPIYVEEKRGLANVTWHIGLERGPYISEGENDEGTFYRAPPGGVLAGNPRDGGIWIPRDPNAMPRIYQYITTTDVIKEVPPEKADCNSLIVRRDPTGQGVDVVAFATGGAIGGVAGRAMAPGNAVSYGQAALGGALGMAIVGTLINIDIGKIIFLAPMETVQFNAKLKELPGKVTPLKLSSQ